MLIRILFIWSMRHPASAYVQGINDLAAPFILVFLAARVENLEQYDVKNAVEQMTEEHVLAIATEDMLKVEADVFWCLSKLIDEIQDNYTEMQPGVHKIINKMKKIIE